ncbi:hypothetical protein CCP1ISM_5770001 [Azospirillaceae bacterium]
MSTAARDVNRSCGPLEAFGWEVQPADQKRVDGLHDSLLGALRKVGFKVAPTRLRSFHSEDLVAYTADKSDRRVLLVWSLSPASKPDQMSQMVLLICDVTRSKK